MLSDLIVVGGGIVWMCAYACKYDAWMRLCEFERELARGKINARVNDAGHAPFECSPDDRIAVGVEAGGIYVSMAIDEQMMCPFQPVVSKKKEANRASALSTFRYFI
jgi:hypothetical protein